MIAQAIDLWNGTMVQPLAFGNSEFFAPLQTSMALQNGTGAPTFTRATIATVTDNEGVIRNCLSGEARFQGARRVQNLLTTPENLPTGWTANVCNTTSGVSDPVGGTTAFTLTASWAGAYLFQSIVNNATSFVASAWIRRRTGTGTVYFRTPDNVDYDITSVLTTSWQRISPPVTGGSGGSGFVIWRLATSGDAIDVWHPQLENVTGQSIQTAGEYVSVGVLSFPYQGAGVDGVQYFATTLTGGSIASSVLKGYLSEGARTNHFLNSSAPVTQTSPSLGTGTYALWITGTGSVAVAQTTATITGAGTATAGAPVIFVVTVAGTVTYTVTGSPTLVQAENGAFPSSYIPTAGSSVPRNADILTFPTAGNISPSVGTVYFEESQSSNASSGVYLGVNEGAAINERIALLDGSANGGLRSLIVSGGAVTADISVGSSAVNSLNKRAMFWATNSVNASQNGILGALDSSAAMPASFARIEIGMQNSTAHCFGTIKNVRIFQRALSSAELQAITT